MFANVFKDSEASKKAWLKRQRAQEHDDQHFGHWIKVKHVITKPAVKDANGKTIEKQQSEWRDAEGKPVSPEIAARIKALVIPPGWRDVRINPDPKGERQVVGRDLKEKQQSKYLRTATQANADVKWSRVSDFHKKAVSKVMQASLATMNNPKLSQQERDVGAVMHLVALTGFRIGSDADTGAKEQAYGASTIEKRHVKLSNDTIKFAFTGKKGVPQEKTITDKALATYLRSKLPTLKPSDNVFTASDDQARKFIKESAGDDKYKPKDFRTWHGTGLALALRKAMPVPKSTAEYKASQKLIAEKVAEHLGNTPTVALASYISPVVWKKWPSDLAPVKKDEVAKEEGWSDISFQELWDVMEEAVNDDTLTDEEVQKGDASLEGFAHVFKDTAASIKAWQTRDHGKGGKPDGNTLDAWTQVNHKLGMNYYELRNQFGQDHPKVKEAYSQWQGAKNFLQNHFNLSKDDIGALSLKAKQAVGNEGKIVAQPPKPKPKPEVHEPEPIPVGEATPLKYDNVVQAKASLKKAYIQHLKGEMTSLDLHTHKTLAQSAGLTAGQVAAMKAHATMALNKNKDVLAPDKSKVKSYASDLAKPASPDLSDSLGDHATAGKVKFESLVDNVALRNTMNNEGHAYRDSLPYAQKFAIDDHIGSGYQEKSKNAIHGDSYDALKQALDHELGHNIKLRRNMAQKWFFQAMGLPHDDFTTMKNLSDEQLNSLVGKTYREKAFSSTTYNTSDTINFTNTASKSGAMYLSIRAPSTTKGVFIGGGEKEVLLQQGTTYMIRKITRLNTGEKWASKHKPVYRVDVDAIGVTDA